MIFIFGITVFNSLASKVEASVTTFSEKVWSIEMSMDIKNTTENLNRIEVMSPENEIININYKQGAEIKSAPFLFYLLKFLIPPKILPIIPICCKVKNLLIR